MTTFFRHFYLQLKGLFSACSKETVKFQRLLKAHILETKNPFPLSNYIIPFLFYASTLLITVNSFAGDIPAPPPLPDETAVEQDYFQKIYRNINRWDIVTSAPDGVLKGVKGQPVLYNNAGTWTLWINIDGELDWIQI